jgi:plastocyanin
MYLIRVALPAVIAVLLGACGDPVGSKTGGGTPPPTGTTPTINTTASSFSPAQVTVDKGGTVLFNIGAVAHTVTFSKVTGAPADIPATSNEQVSRTFNTEGSFAFNCTLHAGMSGAITVK